MIVTPKTRGFICTTAHPTGCSANIKSAADYAKNHPNTNIPKRVLVLGASTGYGLACRIDAAFGGGASTVGVFFEKPPSGKRTASAGYYNNLAFENLVGGSGNKHISINGDAFSAGVKTEVIDAIKSNMPDGKIDLVVYSLAAPKRTDHNGVVHSSVIKPIGDVYNSKTVDFHTGEVSDVTIEPASAEEIDGTVAVMGGEDWLLWMQELNDAGVLADNTATIAFSYIGPELTHAVYTNGTIGMAKKDLEIRAEEITKMLAPNGGRAFVSVNKALVTQASAAIPVVPLYISLLFKLMKANGTHEGCTEQAVRLFDRVYPDAGSSLSDVPTDSEGRIRLDDLEMKPEVQSAIDTLWSQVNTQNLAELSDISGYREDFYALFGFGLAGVDYDKDVEI